MGTFPQGTYDLHQHAAPDVSPRKLDDYELATRLVAAGMKGVALKSHFTDSAARAVLLEKLFPQLHVFGGVVLNRSVGGLNPLAVEKSALTGGRMMWFPTVDSRSYQQFYHAEHPDMDYEPLIYVLDADGKLVPEAVEVLKTAAKYHMVVGSGHVAPNEGMALVYEAERQGVQLVLTHCDLPSNRYTTEQLVEAVAHGAVAEYCYFTVYYHRTELAYIVEQIRAIGCEHVILCTDFGQPASPCPDEGMAMFAEDLQKQGFTDDELMQMMCTNQERLLGVAEN